MAKRMVGLTRSLPLCALISIFLSEIAPHPAHAQLDPISIRSVYTTDKDFNNKLVFKPGDMINYHVDVDNTTGKPFPIYLTFEAFANDYNTNDPHLHRYSHTYHIDQMPVGFSRFYTPVTLPIDVANYIYTVAVIISQENNKTDIVSDESTFAIQTMTQSGSKYQAGNYAGKAGIVGVGRVGSYNTQTAYKEPDDKGHINYCGPGASRVLISAWISNVADIETLKRGEYTDPSWGTYMSCMAGPINEYIGASYYHEYKSNSQQDFSTMIGRDILDNHHPLITALVTVIPDSHDYLNGWDYGWKCCGIDADHIVTIYGFDFTSPTAGYIFYYETAGKVAGTTAPELNLIDYNLFWSLVQKNNYQLAGGSGNYSDQCPWSLAR